MESNTSENLATPVKYDLNRLIENVPFEEYRRADGINSHGLMDVLRSPAHYYEARYNKIEKKESEALQFGKLFHYAILEPEYFQKNYVIQPKFDKRTKIGKEAFQLWLNTVNPKNIIVPEDMVDQLTAMANKVLKHPRARKLLERGVRETTMFWNDRETGELCKMRPDFVTEKGHMVDIKTSKDAREEYFRRDIVKHNYHIQAAHYLAGARETGVCNPDTFVFVVIEKDPPYEIAIYPAGTSVLGIGDQWRSKAMRVYSKCRQTNKWPGYNPDARTIELPQWVEAVDPDEEE